MMEFVYKGKKYSWEEWHEEEKKFIEALELPNDFLEDMVMIGNLNFASDVGYSIAAIKFRKLYNLIASARFSLIRAFEKFYNSRFIKWDSRYIAHIRMRAEYLKNSIIWYNSCEDYLYQIIWFAFDMGGKISSKDNYREQVRNVCYNRIKSKLESLESEYAKELLSNIKGYRFDKTIKYLRENLANSLKHRGILEFKGVDEPWGISYRCENPNDKSICFSSDWIKSDVLDIDDTIEILKELHKKLISFGRYLKDFIGFDAMFVSDDEGNFISGIKKDKKEFKKIVFPDS